MFDLPALSVRDANDYEIRPDLTLKRRKLEERLEKRKIDLDIDEFEDLSDSMH